MQARIDAVAVGNIDHTAVVGGHGIAVVLVVVVAGVVVVVVAVVVKRI